MDNTKRALAEEATEKEIPRAAYEGVLTIDVDAQVESMEEQEDARWHQLLNAHRTRKILTGQLGGIEKLESGWMVAVTYFNGFRIIIPMNEMMINLSGDGRENADTLNRQVRIANNMLGCDIDFIIKDLDAKSRSVVASRKDAMLRKRQTFYFGETGEKPLLYPGRIVEARENSPIETTLQLADIVASAMPPAERRKNKNPSRRTFQALRIAVNHELDALEEGLDTIFDHLAPGGRLCVITFHSLEDRLVKNKFRRWSTACTCPPEFPVCVCGGKAKAKLITRKPIEANSQELEENRRSRSAHLRVLEKC